MEEEKKEAIEADHAGQWAGVEKGPERRSGKLADRQDITRYQEEVSDYNN